MGALMNQERGGHSREAFTTTYFWAWGPLHSDPGAVTSPSCTHPHCQGHQGLEPGLQTPTCPTEVPGLKRGTSPKPCAQRPLDPRVQH